jgi:hypothetical protein
MKHFKIKIFWSALLLFAAFWIGSAYATIHCPTQWAGNGCGVASIPYENGTKIPKLFNAEKTCASCAASDSTTCCRNCAGTIGTINLMATQKTGGYCQFLISAAVVPVYHPEDGNNSFSLSSAVNHPTGRRISILNQSFIC